jgi:hypothetical protein
MGMKFNFLIWTLIALSSHYFQMILLFLILNLALIIYFFNHFRQEFILWPLWLICTIQGKNFKVASKLEDIKKTLQIRDKGRCLEELMSYYAFLPILSLESINGPLWMKLRKNFMKWVEYLPSAEKLGIIADEETKKLIDNNTFLDSKTVSTTTLKVFLKYVFCENHLPLEKNFSHDDVVDMKEQIKYDVTKNKTLDSEAFKFIDEHLTEEFLTYMFESSLEYRKEIAIKGKGDQKKKQGAVDKMVAILKKSKYNDLFEWSDPECFSVVMQPFVISPMINLSDIATSVQKYWDKKEEFKKTMDFIDFCIFNEHPFPVLERFDAKTNTQIFIDLKSLKDNPIYDGDASSVNFGMGMRGCLGRVYARSFLLGFFEPYLVQNKKDLFKPDQGHKYSGRNNDDVDMWESLFTISQVLGLCGSEFIRRFQKQEIRN